MFSELWNRFGDDYHANCLAWSHHPKPIIPPTGEGWQAIWTANPDFLRFGDRLLLYYRGNGYLPGRETAHDRIGVCEVVSMGPGALELRSLNGGRPVVDVGAEMDFDGIDALDPATVVFRDKVFLYYSAIGPGPDSVGLAVSEDGETFEKVGRIMTGRAPDVVKYNGRLRMIYQRPDADGNYQVFLAESEDGFSFQEVIADPVLKPGAKSWDSLSIATVRLTVEGDTIYALYGGSSYLADEPDFFGLARTKDLETWEFHPGNPVFGCGAKGAPDGGAIWFPAIHRTEDAYVLIYEGSPGKYSWDLNSAICLASLPR